MVVSCVKREPPAIEKRLEPGAEIHRCRIAWYADITKISGAITGRNIQAATERHGQMREVSTHTAPFLMTLGRGAIWSRVVVAEFKLIMHVITDRLHALPAADDGSELLPRKLRQLLRIAVAAT